MVACGQALAVLVSTELADAQMKYLWARRDAGGRSHRRSSREPKSRGCSARRAARSWRRSRRCMRRMKPKLAASRQRLRAARTVAPARECGPARRRLRSSSSRLSRARRSGAGTVVASVSGQPFRPSRQRRSGCPFVCRGSSGHRVGDRGAGTRRTSQAVRTGAEAIVAVSGTPSNSGARRLHRLRGWIPAEERTGAKVTRGGGESDLRSATPRDAS